MGKFRAMAIQLIVVEVNEWFLNQHLCITLQAGADIYDHY